MTRFVARSLLLVLALCAAVAASDDANAFDDTTQAEINNARDAARDELSAWATKGESVRGASGPMMQLLLNSGDLICETWIISFGVNLRNLVINGAPDSVIQKMHDLLHKVEAACAEKPPQAVTPGPGGGGGGGGDDGGGNGGAGGGTDGGGKPFVPRPGWTIDDEICWRRCSDKWEAWKQAQRDADAAAKAAAGAAQVAADSAKAAAAADQAADDAEKKRDEARNELRKTRTGTPSAAEQQHLSDLNSAANVDVGKLRDAAKKKHDEADEDAARAKRLADSATAAQAAADAALKAYEDCMKHCYDEAKAARGQTAFHMGPTLGARTGVMIPGGAEEAGSELGDEYAAAIPLELDAGWRFTPNISAIAYGALAYAFPGGSACAQGASCSGWNLRVGLEGQYAFSPIAGVHPWAGLGLGYEVTHFSSSASAGSYSGSLSGFELAHVTGGADWKIGEKLRAGPMVLITFGQYENFSASQTGAPDTSGSIQQTRFHEWFEIGGRGAFDL